MSYKLPKTDHTGFTPEVIIRKADGVQIPFDPNNIDYKEYLEWAKTNTAEPAD
tara:strand:+ start:397 stop:555 length:159 start_codon:yes stop_codon:yes gene_type:complete